jgi:hypothetical protein
MRPAWNIIAFILALSLSATMGVHSATPAIAQKEIDHLLLFVEASGCEFYRNGRWYDSVKAQTHLRTKYEFLEKNNSIASAEDFVEKVATKSSWSGQPYQMKCGEQAAISTQQWLSDELARYRAETENRNK